MNTLSAWGEAETQFFYELTPDRILEAVESFGFRCTGRSLPLNSMENRVYEVEIEVEKTESIKSPSERFRIIKFYRPGRWSKEQLEEEHQFLFDLLEREIPVVAPLRLADGSSLNKLPALDIWFAVFPKIGGRSPVPGELSDEELERVGRLLGRMHAVGAARQAAHRVKLDCETYGDNNLEFLLSSGSISVTVRERYEATVREVIKLSRPLISSARPQRIHGDCHCGNLLWNDAGPFWVDFDDMVFGPCIQDLWLMLPGRDQESVSQLDLLIEAYSQMYPFDRRTAKLIEPLRALRFIHFSAWIAKRWHDPSFPRAFPNFGSERYWGEQLQDMEEQLRLIRGLV